MMKKKILLMCMALMSAMTAWSGQVFIDAFMNGNVNVNSFTPSPGATVTIDVTPNQGYRVLLSNIVVEEVDAGDIYVRTLTVSGPSETPEMMQDFYTFQMPNDASHNVHVRVTFTRMEYPVDCNIASGNGDCEVELINSLPLDTIAFPDPHHIMACMGDVITLKVTPGVGWQLDFMKVNGDPNMVNPNTYEFTMPAQPANVEAFFKPKAYTLRIDPSTVSVADINGVTMTPTVNAPYLEYYPVYDNDLITVVDILLANGYNIQNYILENTDDNSFIASYPGTSSPAGTSFPMPPNNVTLTATYTLQPYTLAVERDHSPEGYLNVTVVDGVNNPVSPTSGGPLGRWDYYTVDVNCTVTVTHIPCPGYVHSETHVTEPYGSYYARYTSDFSFIMPPHDLEIVSDWWQVDYLQVQPSSYGTAQALVNGTDTITSSGSAQNGDLVELSCQPNPGYELDHYELYDAATPNPQLTGLWINPPSNDKFYMPTCGVIVAPIFKLKDLTITIDPNIKNGKIWAIDQTNSGIAQQGSPYYYAHLGDAIQLNQQPAIVGFSPYSFDYYIVNNTQNGNLIGQTRSNVYIMPPFDVTFSAIFYKQKSGSYIDTPFEQWVSLRREGMVLLHELSSKELSSNGWDVPENYGWAHAVYGEPMYFTVAPNLGYQVKKSDITVQLAGVSQGISGPEEYITGPTDFSFIYTGGEVDIDVNFSAIDYTITVEDGIEHGTIEVPATANVEDTVAIFVTPDPGYRLKDITITTETPGYFTNVTESDQFVMPACNVTITATFEQDNALQGDVNGDNDVSIADVSLLIDYLLGNDNGIDLNAADCNLDGNVSVADVTRLIDYLLSGGW